MGLYPGFVPYRVCALTLLGDVQSHAEMSAHWLFSALSVLKTLSALGSLDLKRLARWEKIIKRLARWEKSVILGKIRHS